jgi:outer membrane cobalamin receptor
MASIGSSATCIVMAVFVSAASLVGTVSTVAAQTPQIAAPPAAADANEPLTSELTVTVIGSTPLPGVGLPADEIPAPVRVLSSQAIEASGALDVGSLLNRRRGGVHVNELQGNPYQADVNYRGYTASPLLGTPQGLSIYFDGVRLNQPFGDVVSWDSSRRWPSQSTVMMPGSNPLFGLNTLGGALAIQTKDGHVAPGTSVEAIPRQRRARALEIEHGGSRPSGMHWYLAGTSSGKTGGAITADHRQATLRQSGMAAAGSRPDVLGGVCRQLTHRQRTAGDRLRQSRLRQRVHDPRRHRQPRNAPQPDCAS